MAIMIRQNSTNFDTAYILMASWPNSKRNNFEVIAMLTDAGHRKRVKARFRREGLDGFEEVHALELLLFYGLPRKDTKRIARDLINRFGSFNKVLEAAPESLMQVDGVGEGVATYLKLLNHTVRYYLAAQDEPPVSFEDLNDCGKYLMNIFRGKRQEEIWVMCMDGRKKLLDCQKIAEGGFEEVGLSTRRLVEIALGMNAASVIIAHNHPNGLALPSDEDVIMTRHIRMNLEALGIILVDHMIVGEGDFTSMKQSSDW